MTRHDRSAVDKASTGTTRVYSYLNGVKQMITHGNHSTLLVARMTAKSWNLDHKNSSTTIAFIVDDEGKEHTL